MTTYKAATLLSFDGKLVQAATAEGIRAVDAKGLDHPLLLEELRNRGKLLYGI